MQPVKNKEGSTPIIQLVDRCSEKDRPTKLPGCTIKYWIAKNVPPKLGMPQGNKWRAFARLDYDNQHYTANDEREFDGEEYAWKIAEILASVLAVCENIYLES